MKMQIKHYFIACCCMILLIAQVKAQPKDSAQVVLRINGGKNYPVTLFYNANGEFKSITKQQPEGDQYYFTIPVNGYEQVKIMVNAPQNRLISGTAFTPKPMPEVLVKAGAETKIVVESDDQLLLNIETADKESRLYETFSAQERAYYRKNWDLLQQKAVADETAKTEISKAIAKVSDEFNASKLKFVQDNGNSYAALAVFSSYYMTSAPHNALQELTQLAPAYQQSTLWKTIYDKLQLATATGSGNKIPVFSAMDKNGKIFRSDNLEGQYLLVDFWGSWCQPCRASHPELRELYQKYHKKGLEILGIAYESGTPEQQNSQWEKAIIADQITWRHVLNSKENDLVKLFGVTSYPTKILVNPSGKIIYRSGEHKDDFKKILTKIFE